MVGSTTLHVCIAKNDPDFVIIGIEINKTLQHAPRMSSTSPSQERHWVSNQSIVHSRNQP